ncbi:hypothetical protein IMAU10382_03082 [Lactiplantibacillus plantarum]|nr:hypothetical protein [Lactiplantibacillus plantarum]
MVESDQVSKMTGTITDPKEPEEMAHYLMN